MTEVEILAFSKAFQQYDMYNMYAFMSMADEYNMQLARYTCFTSYSSGRLRFNIDNHFADVCAVRVRHANGCFFTIYFFFNTFLSFTILHFV